MLSFSQFLQLQNRFTGGPSGKNQFDNVAMGQRSYCGLPYATPQTIYQKVTQGSHNRERMQFSDEKGTMYDMQWSYAVPLKRYSY